MGDHVPVDDPQLEERWSEIDRQAEDARSESDSLADKLKSSIDRVTTTINTFQSKFDDARLDSICRGENVLPSETYADATPDPLLKQMQNKRAALLSGIGSAELQLQRAQFLAEHFGCASADHKNAGTTVDRILTLLSGYVSGAPDRSVPQTLAAELQTMADTWKANADKLWSALAERYADRLIDPADLTEHMTAMGLIAELSPLPPDGWLWDGQTDVVALVEELIAGQTAGSPIDVASMYERAADLCDGDDQRPLPKAIAAEVLRLAFGVLGSADRRPINSADKPLLEKLFADGDAIERTAEFVQVAISGESMASPSGGDKLSRTAYESRFDLSEMWTQECAKRLSGLAAQSDGKSRVAALNAALADPSLNRALSAWGQARQDMNLQVLSAASEKLKLALSQQRDRLVSVVLRLDPTGADLSKAITEKFILEKLMRTLTAELSRQAKEIGSGNPVDLGRRMDGLRYALVSGTQVGEAMLRQGRKGVDKLTSSFKTDLQNSATMAKRPSVVAVEARLAGCEDAAKNKRTATLRQPGGTDELSVADATIKLIDAIADARKDTSALPLADRQWLEKGLDRSIKLLIDWMQAGVIADDPAASLSGYDKLISRLRQSYTTLDAPTDLADYWSKNKKSLLAQFKLGSAAPAFAEDFAKNLSQWMAEANRQPTPDPVRLTDLGWTAYQTLSEYRAAVGKLTVVEARLQFLRVLDTLALSIAARLPNT